MSGRRVLGIGLILSTLGACQLLASEDRPRGAGGSGGSAGGAGGGGAAGAAGSAGGQAGSGGQAGAAGDGGAAGQAGDGGARERGTWAPMAPGPLTARGHVRAAFTGTQLVVWGGARCPMTDCVLGDGALYDPAQDRWATIRASKVLMRRADAAAVWTGSEVVVWGGYDALESESARASGARYRPTSNTWAITAAEGAPSARIEPLAVWTSSEMIVWGGNTGGAPAAGGAIYAPTTDTWREISRTNAPTPRRGASAVWAGGSMIVWGGADNIGATDHGARYDPDGDLWTPISRAGAPGPRSNHAAVWARDQMIVFGGQDTELTSLGTGARYSRASDAWMPLPQAGSPTPRSKMVAVWTGSEVLVFGGGIGTQAREQTNTGAIYDPLTDRWTPMTLTGAPSPRAGAAFAWTGTELIVWGGFGAMPLTPGGADYLDTGARFRP